MPQTRVGWRSGQSQQTVVSSLWTSIYAVYNADATGSSSLNTSLYAAYNAESNANDSFGTNNGTAVGGLTYTAGKIGNAFNLNGTNSYITFPNDFFEPTGSFSFNCWFNTSSTNTLTIITLTDVSGYLGFRVFLGGSSRTVTFRTFPSGTTMNGLATSSSIYTSGAWNMVTVVNDLSTGMLIYVNGSLVASNTTKQAISWGSSTIQRLGANWDGGTLFSGSLDGVNLWNKALSSDEITALYNSGNGMEYPYSTSVSVGSSVDALNTYNGTAQGGLTYGVGKIETAFQFNGTNAYVALPDNSLNITGDFSISLWWYVNTTNDQSLLSNMQKVGSNFFGWYLYYDSGWLYFKIGNGTTSFKQKQIDFTAQGGTSNTWQHIVITKANSGPLKLYVNGTERTWSPTTTYNNENPSYSATQKCAIGNVWYGFYDSYVKSGSKIDSVNLWNKILTQTEITELYNSGNGKQYPN